VIGDSVFALPGVGELVSGDAAAFVAAPITHHVDFVAPVTGAVEPDLSPAVGAGLHDGVHFLGLDEVNLDWLRDGKAQQLIDGG